MNIDKLKKDFQSSLPQADFCSLRLHMENSQSLSVKRNVVEPPTNSYDIGYCVTVFNNGGTGYSASADVTAAGIKRAIDTALNWANLHGKYCLLDYSKLTMPKPIGKFASPVKLAWETVGLQEKLDRLLAVSDKMKIHDSIVDWSAKLWHEFHERYYFTSHGGEVHQTFDRLIPMLQATAAIDNDAQTRTMGGHAHSQQSGLEYLDELNFFNKGVIIAEEAIMLAQAPNCPSGSYDLLLAPDQMVLQIHESIGHPLELDRILGDERNYAGTSFVTLDMFGNYQYGSDKLNVTFDPMISRQLASYGFDDDGLDAKREYIIRGGVLERPLGGFISQMRAGMEGVACTRADSWRRPPIDRMANLNLEPGDSPFEQMLSSVERGVFMRTNRSWSIDDSRNKFQFGCEWGQLIENGKLTSVVKNPNYRGISANFWRSLRQVGNRSTFEVLGTPYCGKGEPNQAVFVGHATPPCLFGNIDVFGGVG